MGEKEDLIKSYQKFGAIYPVIQDTKGNIIDGFHRKEAVKNWKTVTIDSDNEAKNQMIGLIANISRREIKPPEITKRLDKIAELTGFAPKQIAEEVGRSERWVQQHISDKYKNTEMSNRGKQASSDAESISALPDTDSEMEDSQPIDTPEDNTGAETTMTETEGDIMKTRKIIISVSSDAYEKLEKEAEKHSLTINVFSGSILFDWMKRRGI